MLRVVQKSSKEIKKIFKSNPSFFKNTLVINNRFSLVRIILRL